MTPRSTLHRVLRLAGIAVAAVVLAAGPTLAPAVPLQAAASAQPAPPAGDDAGTIAYVRRSTHDIHLISPNGAGGRVLWTAPHPPALWAAQDLARRPDGSASGFGKSGYAGRCQSVVQV